jgi:2-amino-4-hydroxy-6-hydroxymethyldihydropteridine diphosphokinase
MSGLVRAYIGVGANLGDPAATLASATAALGALEPSRPVRASSVYRSESIGAPGPDYLNAVVELQTALAPLALLDALQRIEALHGRRRSGERNAPRTLDLDLLLYGERSMNGERLTLPHPRLHERAFVLRPLAELAPGLVVPGRGALDALLARVASQRVDKL